ncbi:MAG: hypothetical protein FJY29_13805 [Betaproteobacteria bacterium]|nr:hypothetical protein [Betaproteobacteria bacterium]
MITLKQAMTLFPVLTACGTASESAKISSERNIPHRGSNNEYGQIILTPNDSASYSLEVIPFDRLALYKIVISESAESSAHCPKYSTNATQTLRVEKKNLHPDFLHFARVCVYFDEGDSGATSLVLANDKLFIGISQEILKKLR